MNPDSRSANGNSDFQHIAVAGISFCGSTLLSMMLGSLDGVDNVGESHKLIINLDMTSQSPGADNAKSGDLIKGCKSCGEVCSVYTPKFRFALRENPSDWYGKIARQRGSKTLVSSDKNYQKLVSKDTQLDLDAIILFKSPLNAANSFYRKVVDPSFVNHQTFDLDYVTRSWETSYSNFLNQFENTGKKLFLNFEHFCQSPALHMEILCQHLNLEYSPSCVHGLAQGQHYFGGNVRVNRPYRNKQSTLSIDKRDELILPEEHRQEIMGNDQLALVYQSMMAQYEEQFTHFLVTDSKQAPAA